MNKEKYVTNYIVEWKNPESKEPDILFRYIDNGKGYWCEGLSLLDDGKWDKENYGMDLVLETHNIYYDKISKKQAEEIAKKLGGSIYDD